MGIADGQADGELVGGSKAATDLDVPARGSAHAPARRGGTKI
jgi:hypothetical protein